MNFVRTSPARQGIRDYAEAPVARRTLEVLIATAIEAVGDAGEQHFTVIRDQPLLDQMSMAAKAYLLATIGGSPGREEIRQYLLDPDFQIFHHAPVVILVSAKHGAGAVEDASIAAQNLMLAARELGLGACWIDFARNWLATDEGRRSIELPSEYQPVAPIIAGRPHGTASAPGKTPVIRWIG
jgi:nitroreductase